MMLIDGLVVLPAIGAVFLTMSVLYFEARHAFTTRYVVYDDGIDVHPYGELPRFLMWSEIDKVVIWRFYQWCELHTRTLQKPVIISNTKSDISQADFQAGLRSVKQSVHVPIELKLF